MPKPAPYSFHLKSRAAIVDFLMNRFARSYDYTTYRFCWNVKTYGADFDGDSLRKHFPNLQPEFDSVYQVDWDSAIEDARSMIDSDEWTSYPGDDQGNWEFHFDGRSGGWLVLDKWRGRDMRNPCIENLSLWDFDTLKAFYRGIVCADSDFTQAKSCLEVEYQAAFRRECWEDEQITSRNLESTAWAATMESARPDMYHGVAS